MRWRRRLLQMFPCGVHSRLQSKQLSILTTENWFWTILSSRSTVSVREMNRPVWSWEPGQQRRMLGRPPSRFQPRLTSDKISALFSLIIINDSGERLQRGRRRSSRSSKWVVTSSTVGLSLAGPYTTFRFQDHDIIQRQKKLKNGTRSSYIYNGGPIESRI